MQDISFISINGVEWPKYSETLGDIEINCTKPAESSDSIIMLSRSQSGNTAKSSPSAKIRTEHKSPSTTSTYTQTMSESSPFSQPRVATGHQRIEDELENLSDTSSEHDNRRSWEEADTAGTTCSKLWQNLPNSEPRLLPLLDSACSSMRSDWEGKVSDWMTVSDSHTPNHIRNSSQMDESVISDQWTPNATVSSLHPRMAELVQILSSIDAKVKAGPRWNLERYLSAFDSLVSARQEIQNLEHDSPNSALRDADELLEVAVKYLEEEFHDAMIRHSTPLSTESLQAIVTLDNKELLESTLEGVVSLHEQQSQECLPLPSPSYPAEKLLREWLLVPVVPYLKQMAQKMKAADESARCCAVYRRVRSEALKQSISNLRLEELRDAMQSASTWPAMQTCIREWMRGITALVGVLLQGECALSLSVMECLEEEERSACIQGVMADSLCIQAVTQLLRIAHMGMAASTKMPERLFGLLDMFSTLRKLAPKMLQQCPMEEKQQLKRSLDEMLHLMHASVLDTFTELQRNVESLQLHNATVSQRLRLPWRSQSSQPDAAIIASGDIHPVTSYLVNYIRVYLNRRGSPSYLELLEELLLFQPLDVLQGEEKVNPSVDTLTNGLLESLRTSLEMRVAAQSKTGSSDVAVGALFLMNNFNYVLTFMSDKSICIPAVDSDGCGWKELVDTQARLFQKAALAKIFKWIPKSNIPALGDSTENRRDCNKKLKFFNCAFEALALQQSQWKISDEGLKFRVKRDWAASIETTYSEFLTPHRQYVADLKHFRYTPNRLRSMIASLFFIGQLH